MANHATSTAGPRYHSSSQPGFYYPYRTPHGMLTIRVNAAGITHVALGDVTFDGQRKPTDLAGQAATQIMEYLARKRRAFDLPLDAQGSAYQQEVWEAVRAIPYGSSCTCADIAAQLGNGGSYRAVGAALNKNPLTILVPAHRVVTAAGKPLGSGREAQLRGALLRMEQEVVRG